MNTLRALVHLARITPMWWALRIADKASEVTMAPHWGELGEDGVYCMGHGRDYPLWPCREYIREHEAMKRRAEIRDVLVS